MPRRPASVTQADSRALAPVRFGLSAVEAAEAIGIGITLFLQMTEDRSPALAKNPAIGVDRIRNATLGHHTWSTAEIEQFLAHHKAGSKARLAFALAAFTGLRVSDLSKIGPQHIRGGWLRMPIHKNRARKPKVLEIPILPALAQVLASAPPVKAGKVDHMVFLTKASGEPFSIKGLGNKFKAWCVEAGLPHCSAHGIRKAGATYAAERGATEHQLMALFGWDDPKQAATYTKAARKRVLAESAIGFLAAPQIENEIPHLFEAVPAGEGNPGKIERKINAG